MKSQNHFASVVMIPALLFLFHGCSTRHFIVRSVPEGSMVLMGRSPDLYGFPDEICGTAPLNKTVTFMGKNDRYYFTSLTRGYESDTVFIGKDSETTIDLTPKKMESFSTEQNPSYTLEDADFYLLPVNTNVIIHKGVGNLDKYVRSDELSKIVADNLDAKLKATQLSDQVHYLSNDHFSDLSDWKKSSDLLSEYLLKLKSELLVYYPLPPAIPEDDLRMMKSLLDTSRLSPMIDTMRKLLVYVWCKSTEPTRGRVIGNIAANIGSGVVQGYETAAYGYPVTTYDPQAFALDYTTIWMVFVIEPERGRIIHISQYTMPFEITKPVNRDKLVNILANLNNHFTNQSNEK